MLLSAGSMASASPLDVEAVLVPAFLLPDWDASLLLPPLPASFCFCFLFFSSSGKPHPHFSHFLSMCCSHIVLQRRSSSASAFQLLLTCAARPSETASRNVIHFRAISRGSTAKGSRRHSAFSFSERNESWDGQQMVRRPRRVRSRAAPDDEEKSDQMVLAVCWSTSGNFSSC